MTIFRNVAERYKSNKELHFNMHYRYAAEDKPTVWLDSLKGDFTFYGDRYRYRLDSTEFVGGKDLSVILFKQDQVMYLARPGADMRSVNPMALLDSLLLKNDSVDCNIQETKDWQTIVLSFHPVRTTKRVEYVVDRHSGFIIRMINVVAARELYDASVRQKVTNEATYAIVETDLSDYRETDVAKDEWDLGRLFKKDGKEYIPQPPYQSYKIFLGSPDL
ncbi:MAG: hypothetical protein BGO55_10015 [Sphingobacteriales bacterium 50-39]|nr:MAG: hypothetical protein BGO55_10015 [Sphingobacteriales bacterium 50-39]